MGKVETLSIVQFLSKTYIGKYIEFNIVETKFIDDEFVDKGTINTSFYGFGINDLKPNWEETTRWCSVTHPTVKILIRIIRIKDKIIGLKRIRGLYWQLSTLKGFNISLDVNDTLKINN